MSDPIKDLENFSDGGLTVNPLAPSEVRRLGTRMRRRRNAAAVVASVAAVAVIATPFALIAGKDDAAKDLPPTNPTPSETADQGNWITTIPDDFPLASGWPDPATAEEPETAVTGPARGLEEFTLQACGNTLPDPGSADRMNARWRNAEDYRNRELRTFRTDQEAVTYLAHLRALWQDCPVEEPETGGEGGGTRYREIVPTDLGEESFALVDKPGPNGIYLGVIQVVRVGNAVQLTIHDSHGNADYVPTELAAIRSQSAEILDAMQMFAAPAGDPLTQADLITAGQSVLNGFATWETRSTFPGDGQASPNPCFTEGLTERGASTVFGRDFDLTSPADEGPVAGAWMTARVAEFPDAEGAAAAYDSFAQDMSLCEQRLLADGTYDQASVPEPQVVDTQTDGEARRYTTTFGPVEGDEFQDFVNIMETGMALVGNRVVLLSLSIVAMDYNYPDGTPMEQMLPVAAEQLLPG